MVRAPQQGRLYVGLEGRGVMLHQKKGGEGEGDEAAEVHKQPRSIIHRRCWSYTRAHRHIRDQNAVGGVRGW